MKTYKRKAKTFVALKWDGTNESEFDEEVQCEVAYDGELEVCYWSEKLQEQKKLTVPQGYYLVIPSYGKMRVLDEHQFSARFGE